MNSYGSGIKIENLTKKFGALAAVDNINLEIRPGEIYGFLGPNGAGKTTTVKILSGLLRPTSGTASIGGFNILTSTVEAKKILAFVPDEPFVYPKLAGAEFLQFVGDLHGVPRAVQDNKIPELLEMFELEKWGGELLESYSHGMRQKLVIAGVLLRNPDVILMDEPMVGLDPKSARLVRKILSELAEEGKTIFMCTHILEIAERLCSRIGIMYEGKIIVQGTLEELKKRTGEIPGGPAASAINLEDIFLSLTADASGREYSWRDGEPL